MNTLTPNRIIEKGDEYFGTDGIWRAVPEGDLGLQVIFTKYREVRRPTEPEAKISPDSERSQSQPSKATETTVTDKAEAKQVPASGVSPAGRESPPPKPLSETYGKPKEAKVLPTVVSTKAHKRAVVTAIKAEAAATSALPKTTFPPDIRIPYSDLSQSPIWIGRNGTFKATAMRVTAKDGLIQIRPEGARGLAKNALIEFPVTEIEKVVDFLLRHQPTITPK